METPKRISSQEYHEGVWGALKEQDEPVYELLVKEYERLQNSLQLIAAENLCTRAVLAALGSIVQNKTTEGFPRARFHGGCEVVDDIEELAVARAKETFSAQYANVQPHSGTAANQIVLTAILEPGDRVLSLGLNQGGHVSHGAKVSFGGKFFTAQDYYVDSQTYRLDYERIRQQAAEFKPKLIVCGASAYSRTIDFHQFREIADEVGAYLMADISHIAGLVIAGAHPSPIDEAHFTTTSTYKPGGPRGGLILMGKDYDSQIEVSGKKVTLWRLVQKTTFPGVQGTPYLNNVAAKAVFFKETLSDEYRSRQFKIIENAKRLADNVLGLGYDVLTGGTDNHMVMINIANLREGMTGAIAQECLEDCGIVVNKNRLPYDTRTAAVTSGLRLGTPIVTRNGMGPEQMDVTAGLIDTALRQVKIISEREYEMEDSLKDDIRKQITDLCHQFPMF
jgi:glycine hydroxymethyltransferase